MYKILLTIICFSTITLTIYRIFLFNKKVKKCWNSIKCTTYGQIMYPIFGPKNGDFREHSRKCESAKYDAMYNSKTTGVENNVSLLTNASVKINNNLNNVRKKIQSMQKYLYNDLKNIARKIFDAYGRIAQLLVVLYGVIYKVSEVFNNLITLMRYAYFTLGSTWNGPIGGTARYFAGYM